MNEKNKELFIQKSKEFFGNKYDYTKVEYFNNKKNVIITCPLHEDFFKTPLNHTSRRQGCPKCSNELKRTLNALGIEKFIEKSKKKHGNKYIYTEVEYHDTMTPVTIKCFKHGNFSQTPFRHLQGSGCPKCAPEIRGVKFIKKTIQVHGNYYNYDKVNYIGALNKVTITCPKHGDFSQTPNDHLKGSGCPGCAESKGEKHIAELLTNKNITFIRQKTFEDCKGTFRKLLFDFYLPEYNTLIEYDGRQHFEAVDFFGGYQSFERMKLHDKIKNEFADKNNIKLIRINYAIPFNEFDEILFKEIN
jgi:hypothetical protein